MDRPLQIDASKLPVSCARRRGRRVGRFKPHAIWCGAPASKPSPAVGSRDDPGPSKHLVTSLIEAYEAADDDPDPQTRLLLGRVLHHVGRRVAA